MKLMFRKMTGILLVAMLSILLFDNGKTVAADDHEEKNIAVGVEYRVGDIIKSETYPYYMKDDRIHIRLTNVRSPWN